MEWEVIIPPTIHSEIQRWALPTEVEAELYRVLGADLAYGHETTCYRLPAPSPTYVYLTELADPLVPALAYAFTFHLTYGPRDNALYVQYCRMDQREDWGQDKTEEDLRDEGSGE